MTLGSAVRGALLPVPEVRVPSASVAGNGAKWCKGPGHTADDGDLFHVSDKLDGDLFHVVTVKQLEAKLQATSELLKSRDAQLATAAAELSRKSSFLDNAGADLTFLRCELERKNISLGDQQQSQLQLSLDLDLKRSQESQHVKANHLLVEEIDVLNDDIKALVDLNATVKSDHLEQAEQLEVAAEALRHADARIAVLDDKVIRLTACMCEKDEWIAELESTIAEGDEEAARLRGALTSAVAEATAAVGAEAEVEAALEERNEVITALRRDLDMARREVDDERVIRQRQEGQLAAVGEELAGERHQREAAAEAMVERNRIITAARDEVRRQLGDTQQALATLKTQVAMTTPK